MLQTELFSCQTPVEIALALIKKVFPTKPEWKDDLMYSAIANDNLAVLKEYSNAELATKLLFMKHYLH